MHLRFVIFISTLCIFHSAFGQKPPKLFEEEKSFINHHIFDGRVNYETIKNDSLAFAGILKSISNYDLTKSGYNEQVAFYINAYNLFVIAQIASQYPSETTITGKGFYDEKHFTAAGKPFTLNQLEKEIHRISNDWRIQWAVVKGDGCAFPLRLYLPLTLNESLTSQQKAIYAGAGYIMIDDAQKTIWLHPQFRILNEQLESSGINLISHININSNRQLPYTYHIKYNDCKGINLMIFEADSLRLSENNSIENNQIQDEETGLDVPSNFIGKGHLELRATDNFYTQKAIYNNKMNRIDDDNRYTYNTLTLKTTYGVTDYLNFGFYYSVRHALTEVRTESPFDVFTSPSKFKNINQSMQVFGKVKIYETKTRLTFLTSVTMPIQTKQPFLEYENGIDRYIVRGNLIFDIFFIPTIRLTLVGGNDFDFDMAVDKMYYRFRPSAEFNAQLIQYKKIRCSAGVDFNWMYGDNGFINFGAREYVAATYNLAKHLNINANFNYFFIGKNIGAGYYITGGMRYLF